MKITASDLFKSFYVYSKLSAELGIKMYRAAELGKKMY
jgi:hypothetical protein